MSENILKKEGWGLLNNEKKTKGVKSKKNKEWVEVNHRIIEY